MRLISRLLFLAAVLTSLTLGRSSAQGEPLKIVASFSILADVVHNVTLNRAEVTSLIPVGADPHSYEPSAQDIAALEDTDLVFVAGANFEESLLRTIEAVASGAMVIEASACVPIRAYAGDEDHDEDEEHADEADNEEHEEDADAPLGLDIDALCDEYDTYLTELDAFKAGMGFASSRAEDNSDTLGRLHDVACGEHEQDEHADEEGDEHEEGSCDPHVWTDPRNVEYWILLIRDALSAADSENADVYYANAEEYLYLIDDLVRLELEPLLDAVPAERRVLLTNHETFGYFAAAYGFEVAGFVLPGGSALAEPSARDLAALIDQIRDEGVPAIFAENTLASRVAEQVASETGAQFYTLYSDSLSAADGPAATYQDYLYYNFTTIAEALTP